MERNQLQQLRLWREKPNRKPLILRGVRQVGKTYLLRSFGQRCFDQFHYFNFEEDRGLSPLFDQSLQPGHLLTELQFRSGRAIDPERDLVIFDEIQETPRALTSLKYFQEEMPQLALCAAGSLLGVHLSAGSFPVGKVELLDLHPLSFAEFLRALGEEACLHFLQEWRPGLPFPLALHQRLWEQLKWYFVVGGLPEVVRSFAEQKDNLFLAFQEARTLQQQLLIAYLADIAKHAGKANAMHVERVLRAIPSQLAKSEDGTAQRFQFKGVVPNVDKYSRLVNAIDWLEAARLAIKIQVTNSGQIPFSAYTAESRFKLLLCDVGLLGAMSSLPFQAILQYDYGSYKGYFAENFAAQELLCSGFSPLYAWQEGRSELEFLIQRGGRVHPIQVKPGRATKAQSLAKFRQKYQPSLSLLLSANPCATEEGLWRLPLYMAGFLPQLLASALPKMEAPSIIVH